MNTTQESAYKVMQKSCSNALVESRNGYCLSIFYPQSLRMIIELVDKWLRHFSGSEVHFDLKTYSEK